MTDPNDKRPQYNFGMHCNEEHTENETKPSEGVVNDWHSRHQDKLLDDYCDTHPGAPECKVFDE